MRQHIRKQMVIPFICIGILLELALGLGGCSGGSEEQGRIRVSAAQAVGVYELGLSKGSERLELKADGTYVQEIISPSRPLHHSSHWYVVNHLFDGSEIILVNAAISSQATPLDTEPQLRFGDLPMYAHDRSGKLALARNEVLDWYYERVQQ